jgi:hypothetical protein
VPNLTYGSVAAPAPRLDVYLPPGRPRAGSRALRPVVLYVHGGGFRILSKNSPLRAGRAARVPGVRVAAGSKTRLAGDLPVPRRARRRHAAGAVSASAAFEVCFKTMRRLHAAAALAASIALPALLVGACGSSSETPAAPPAVSADAALDAPVSPDASDGGDPDIDASDGGLVCDEPAPNPLATTEVRANLNADFSSAGQFYDFPLPSDVRLDVNGAPDFSGFPQGLLNKVVYDLLLLIPERLGWPSIPVAWFQFSAPLPDLSEADTTVVAAAPSSTVLLIDTDESSPERGRLFPIVVTTPTPDGLYVPPNLLAVGPRPGIVLAPHRTYAFVVMRSFEDAAGNPLAVADTMAELMAGQAPAAPLGEQARALYASLPTTLLTAGICPNQVAAATVFTTGDVVADTADLTRAAADQQSLTIDSLVLDPDDGAAHEQYCELRGSILYPQFQQGSPPFNTYGRFDLGPDGLPVKQGDEAAPVVIAIPKAPMPTGGYPLLVYFHGSGGRSTAVVDRGLWHTASDPATCPEHTLDTWNGQTGCNTQGMGPAHYLAAHGIASAGSALPLNPERYPGAGETAYLNLLNLSAFRDTFRQGILEQRMFLDALLALEIPPAALAGCNGPSLPSGATGYRFQSAPVLGQGQSMGGMYTNMVGAVDPRVAAVAPTGAGGHWSYFILVGNQVPGGAATLALVLGTSGKLTFMHPAMHLLALAWEPAEPLVYMPRLARRPLAGHPVRQIYEPVGKDDSYFPMTVYDAVALAYAHAEAGDLVWPSMQQALALVGLDGLLPYPVADDRQSIDGAPYTGVVVQYLGDGLYDPHAIYSQLDAVKYQYGCFFATFVDYGIATVPAPMPLGTPCPH